MDASCRPSFVIVDNWKSVSLSLSNVPLADNGRNIKGNAAAF